MYKYLFQLQKFVRMDDHEFAKQLALFQGGKFAACAKKVKVKEDHARKAAENLCSYKKVLFFFEFLTNN
jgi:hypothetical protein